MTTRTLPKFDNEVAGRLRILQVGQTLSAHVKAIIRDKLADVIDELSTEGLITFNYTSGIPSAVFNDIAAITAGYLAAHFESNPNLTASLVQFAQMGMTRIRGQHIPYLVNPGPFFAEIAARLRITTLGAPIPYADAETIRAELTKVVEGLYVKGFSNFDMAEGPPPMGGAGLLNANYTKEEPSKTVHFISAIVANNLKEQFNVSAEISDDLESLAVRAEQSLTRSKGAGIYRSPPLKVSYI